MKDRIKNMEALAIFMEFTPIDSRKRNDQIFHTQAPFLGDAILDCDYSGGEPTATRENQFRCSEMLFDSSWDWLMPVVKKMSELEDGDEESFEMELVMAEQSMMLGLSLGEINEAFKGIMIMLKWYNKNK